MSGWGMGFLFGGNSVKKKELPKQAILRLRSTQEMLSKREAHLQSQIDDEDAKARKFVNTNKIAAKNALRKKKQLETDLEKTSAQMLNLDGQISSIETANINKETLDAMKDAVGAYKAIHAGMDIGTVDNIMADLEDQHAIGDEISQALANGPNQAVDDEELDAELSAMQQEELDEKMLKTGSVPVADQVYGLPSPAHGELTSNRNKALPQRNVPDAEDEELERLKAEMAM